MVAVVADVAAPSKWLVRPADHTTKNCKCSFHYGDEWSKTRKNTMQRVLVRSIEFQGVVLSECVDS